MKSCVMCGSAIPDDQGSNTCSMCYGDPGHGKDGYYQKWLDDIAEADILNNKRRIRMREIKFRGRRIDNGEWVYGSLLYFKSDGCCEIVLSYDFSMKHEVDPETVGQYIGLKDKDGQEIYENDIIDIGNGEIFYVEWNEYERGFCFAKNKNNRGYIKTFKGDSIDTWKKIGDKFTNPELLEKK